MYLLVLVAALTLTHTHTHTLLQYQKTNRNVVWCVQLFSTTLSFLQTAVEGKKKKHDDISHAGETSRQRQPFDPVTSPDFAALQNNPAPGTTAHRLSVPEPVSWLQRYREKLRAAETPAKLAYRDKGSPSTSRGIGLGGDLFTVFPVIRMTVRPRYIYTHTHAKFGTSG